MCHHGPIDKTITNFFAVLKGHGWNKNFFPSKEMSVIVPSSLTDLFKTSAERGRARCNTIATAKLMEWMPNNQDLVHKRSRPRGVWRDSVVRSCCGTLKGMVLGFESGLVWSTYYPNINQHRHRVCFEITVAQPDFWLNH